jgi:hypothetical protein
MIMRLARLSKPTSFIDTTYAVGDLAFGRAVLFLLLFSFFRPAGLKNENS